jgi:hypothetical protein
MTNGGLGYSPVIGVIFDVAHDVKRKTHAIIIDLFI